MLLASVLCLTPVPFRMEESLVQLRQGVEFMSPFKVRQGTNYAVCEELIENARARCNASCGRELAGEYFGGDCGVGGSCRCVQRERKVQDGAMSSDLHALSVPHRFYHAR